jgi:hypothetical protein
VVLLVGTIATTGVVIGLLDGWTGAVVLAAVISVAVGAALWLSWQPPERDRRPLYWMLAGVALILPVAVGFVGCAVGAALRLLLIAAVAPAAVVLALAPPWGDGAARRDPMLGLSLLVLVAPLGLLATTLLV